MSIQFSALREEPFRLFFPLAALATLGGVALWPMLHYGLLGPYPGVMHARIMTASLGGFVIGFLGTAFPRLIDARPLRGWELVLLLALWLASLGFYFLNRISLGDGLFAIASSLLMLGLLARWLFEAHDTPPPGMPVALVGVWSGGIAAAALAWQEGLWMSPVEYRLSQLVLYQGMGLLCLLGVGPYLFPRLLGHPSPHSFETAPAPPSGWWRPFMVSVAAGGLVHGSFLVEAGGASQWGMGLRAGVVLIWLLVETPLLRRAIALTTCGTVARVALLSIVISLAWAAADPSQRIAILHLLLVSGLGLVMLGIGVRVVLGHAGRHDMLTGKLGWLRVVIGLVLLAATTRVSADFLPRIRVSHLDYAAVTWIAAAILWLWKLGRWFFPRASEEDSGRCPKARGRSDPAPPAGSPELREEGPGG